VSKKIAILTRTFNYYSGVDRVAQDNAEKLTKKGHDVTVIALEAKIKSKSYKIIELGKPNSPFLEKIQMLYPFLINKRLKGYDEIISFIYPMDVLAYQAKKRYNTKYIAWFSGIADGDHFLEKIYMYFYKKIYYWHLKRADEIRCVSNFVKNKLLENNTEIDINKTKLEYNTIDDLRFNKNVKTKYKNKVTSIINTYNLKNKKVFLYVGRISYSKRIDLLIKIFKRERRENPESKLIIVGQPTIRNYFRKVLKMADEDIIFTGFVKDEDMPAYYAVSDVYVTASKDEGFNLPAVEAHACGLPVIAFDVGVHRELFDKFVNKGILIEDKNINEFANSMIKFTKLA